MDLHGKSSLSKEAKITMGFNPVKMKPSTPKFPKPAGNLSVPKPSFKEPDIQSMPNPKPASSPSVKPIEPYKPDSNSSGGLNLLNNSTKPKIKSKMKKNSPYNEK